MYVRRAVLHKGSPGVTAEG